MRARHWPLLAVALGILAPSQGFAQTTPAPASAPTFEQLAKKGDDARAARRWSEAVVAYSEALAIRPDLTVSGRLGLCLFELGEFAGAASQLHHVIEEPAAIASDAERARFFAAYQQARSKVCRVDVTIDQLGARVDVDGRTVRKGPIDFWFFLEPGTHEMRASLPGFEDETKQINAEAGKRLAVPFQMRAKSGAVVAPKPETLPGDEPPQNVSTLSKDEPAKSAPALPKDEPPKVGGFMVGAGIVGVLGATPGGAIGGQLFGGWRRGWFSVGVEGRAAWGLEAPPGLPSYQVTSFALGGGPCVHWRAVFGCVLGQVSWLDMTYSEAARALGLGFRVGAEPFTMEGFRLRVWGDLLPRFDGQRVGTPSSNRWVAPPLAMEIGVTGLFFF